MFDFTQGHELVIGGQAQQHTGFFHLAVVSCYRGDVLEMCLLPADQFSSVCLKLMCTSIFIDEQLL